MGTTLMPPNLVPKVAFGTVAGPASYAAGGFTVDVTASLASVGFGRVILIPAGTTLNGHMEYTLDSPASGQFKVKLMQAVYSRVTSIGNPTNLPAGVTEQTASGATTATENAHTHDINHNHAAVASFVPGGGGLGNTTGGAANLAAHTHSVDLPAFTGTSGVGTAHSHVDNNIYEHQHSRSSTTTATTLTELTVGTDLSGLTWRWVAVGV